MALGIRAASLTTLLLFGFVACGVARTATGNNVTNSEFGSISAHGQARTLGNTTVAIDSVNWHETGREKPEGEQSTTVAEEATGATDGESGKAEDRGRSRSLVDAGTRGLSLFLVLVLFRLLASD
jgi:hypothetical protein